MVLLTVGTCFCVLFCRFPQEWEATSSHRTRNSKDMQFAFSYYYYLLGQKKPLDIGRLFDEMDTDHSGLVCISMVFAVVTMCSLHVRMSIVLFVFVSCCGGLCLH